MIGFENGPHACLDLRTVNVLSACTLCWNSAGNAAEHERYICSTGGAVLTQKRVDGNHMYFAEDSGALAFFGGQAS
jgi:hypothetical protein